MTQLSTNRKPDYSSATREQLLLRIDQLERTVARLKVTAWEHEWLEELIANPTLTGNDKCAIYGTHKAAGKRQPREKDGLTLVHRAAISKNGGIDEQAVSESLTKLAKYELMRRKSENAYDEEAGTWKRGLFVGLETLYENPSVKLVREEDDPAPGGKREKGKSVKRSVCCDAPVKPLERYTCTGCGSELKPSEVIEVSEEMLANEAKLQEELKEIAVQREAAAAGYPQEIMAMMDAEGVHRLDHRACLICGQKNWLPAYKHEQWQYDCGYCHPFLATSLGRDLRKREDHIDE